MAPLGSENAERAKEWQQLDCVDSGHGLGDLSVKALVNTIHGTKVVLACLDGPLCSVNMFFATEASDDKGLPHCLEHLCFMGSQSYQRGYLDLLATRCGSEGPNAYTESDHTCYQFEAAGDKGMLAVLPVFIDHVLCPLLSEEAFLTEIYHVNGKGQRQGVVYSEMLGRVTDQEDMLDLELRKATFGEGTPYSYEHGGMPASIMKLTRKEVADYHKQVYTTDNLSIVVSGCFDEGQLLSVISASLSASVASGAGQTCVQRPFVSPLPSLPESCARRRSICFPSDDVSVGSVAYSHRLKGVSLSDVDLLAALDVISRYLVSLASSPLEQVFVQCSEPIASGVSCDVHLTADPHMTLEFHGVPFRASPQERAAAKRMGSPSQEKDGEGESDEEEDVQNDPEEGVDDDNDSDDEDEPDWFVGDGLLKLLVIELRRVRDALQSEEAQVLADMRRAVQKEIVSRRKAFEDGPSEFLCDAVGSNCIFDKYPCREKQNLLSALSGQGEVLSSLEARAGSWWAELLDCHLLEPLSATLVGLPGGTAEVRACPSSLLASKSERQEEIAEKENKKRLGAKKLKALQAVVDGAEEAGKIPLSSETRALFPPPASPAGVPDLRWEMKLMAESPQSPVEVLEVETSSAFSELRLSWKLDDSWTGLELRRYLPLFAELFCETNVSGEDYRKVVARLDHEMVDYSSEIGNGSDLFRVGSHPHLLTLQLSAEPEKAASLVNWAVELSHECDFPQDKVRATCRRMVADLKESMRDAENVLAQVITCALYSPMSPQVQCGAFSQKCFLESCSRDVAGTCLALKQLANAITKPGTACTAVVSGSSAEHRGSIVKPLQDAWRKRYAAARPGALNMSEWGAGSLPSTTPLLPLRHLVVGCAGSDTSHVQIRTVLPDPQVALDAKKSWTLRLLCEALSMMEGPLSQAVRGKGLAYGASVGFSPYDNAVVLELWECTNLRKGLEAALSVLRDAITGDGLSPFQLDNARGSLVFQLKGKRATPTDIVDAAVGSASRGLRSAAETEACESQLSAVTRDDVLAAHARYVLPLCDPSRSIACVVCEPAECKAKAKGLAACLGLKSSQVLVKETLADCYEIVDSRIRSCAKLAE
ncbi:unnamed protein product [Polarella glacialis]|uniref:Uncharacterized protein n=1 Tax=Polarella glacialis TaxID=89957 RepID=A0A813EQ23_POLGL|nr:unnamed protein product [Polarella glacialis]